MVNVIVGLKRINGLSFINLKLYSCIYLSIGGNKYNMYMRDGAHTGPSIDDMNI